MQRVLSVISAFMLGLAVMFTSVASSSAAPVSPMAVQTNSVVEHVQWRKHHRPAVRHHRPVYRNNWRRPHHRPRWQHARRDHRWHRKVFRNHH